MRALIIGAGYLGKAVESHFRNAGVDVISTFNRHPGSADQRQFDLFYQPVATVIDLSAIDVVVVSSKIEHSTNTAAVSIAMGNLFSACRNKRVVYLSSDAVFDGEYGNYIETDIPNPTTPYGRHKYLCEQLLKREVVDHCIIRSSYIYGYSVGQLDQRLMSAIETMREGNAVRRYVDMFKSPVEVNQLATVVLNACLSDYRGVVHACGERVSVFDFHAESLLAMGESVQNLLPDHMPQPLPTDCLRDTSLISSLLFMRFQRSPMSLSAAFGGNGRECEVSPLHHPSTKRGLR